MVTEASYDPVTNITTWQVPFLVYLKVAQLSTLALDAGNITAGDFYGTTAHGGTGYPTSAYAWPVNGGNGYHLSAAGLLLGNANLGKYFQLDAAGNVFAPQFSIVNGTAIFSGALGAASGTFAGALSAATGTFAGALSGATGTFSGSMTAAAVNAVNTINLAGQAVTIPVGAVGGSLTLPMGTDYVDCVSVSIASTGAPVLANWAVSVQNHFAGVGTRLLRDGAPVVTLRSTGGCFLDSPGVGTHTYTVQCAFIIGSASNDTINSSTIMCLEAKR
jgi:hypothetical protein